MANEVPFIIPTTEMAINTGIIQDMIPIVRFAKVYEKKTLQINSRKKNKNTFYKKMMLFVF